MFKAAPLENKCVAVGCSSGHAQGRRANLSYHAKTTSAIHFEFSNSIRANVLAPQQRSILALNVISLPHTNSVAFGAADTEPN
jgi:hypothetical protein